MAIRFDEIEFSGSANHYYPIIKNEGGVIHVQTASGYVRIAPGNSSYSHFTTDRGSFYFNNPVAFDGNITAYGTNETATFASFINRNDSNAYLTNTTLVLRSGDPTIYMRDTDHRSVALHTNSNRFYVLGAPVDSTTYTQVNGVWPWYVQLDTNDVYTGRIGYANNSYRAPIFYDKDNTAYFCNPNSTSNFVGLTVANTINGTSTNALRLVREDNRTISPSEETAGRLRFGFTSYANNNSSPYADFLHMRSYTDSSGGSDNLLMFKKSGFGMRLWQQGYGSSTAYSSYVDMIHTGSDDQIKSGYIQSNASLRAPIFYDSGNTGYYADPNSSSRLHNIVVGDGTPDTTPDGTTFSNTIKSTGGSTRVVNFEGAGGSISTWYTIGNTAYGAIDQNTSYMSFWQNLGSGWQEQFRIYRGYQQSLNSLRAPLFYDSNNTAYYLDPNNTGTSLNAAGELIGSNINTFIKYLGVGVSYDTDRSTKVTDGIALYGAYNGGSNSPHTYDFSAQFVGNSRGFELSAAWHAQTALYIRTLRDCCQNWSSWYAIAIHGLNLGTTAGALYAGAFYDSGSTAYFNDMANTTLSSRQLGPSEFRTSAGNTRGYIQATDTNDQHFIIATSGGEDIAFKDGGLGGTTNMIIRGDGDVNVPGFITTPKIIVTTGSIASSDAGTKGLIIHGNYTDGKYAHRFRKQDLGGNVVLYLDQSGGTANSFTWLTRFGAYSGNSIEFEVNGDMKANGDIHCARLYDNNTTFYFDGSDTGTAIRVAGDIVAYYSSDERFKDNVKPIENSLDKIDKISGYTFEWNELSHKETGKKDVGVIAQEVEEVLPEVVETRSNGYKAVDYQKLTALLIESVKELKAEVQELKKQINGST